MTLTDTKKRLALSIIDFLQTSVKDGTLSSDDAESVEIASSCIAESFKVDPSDKAAMSSAVEPQNLQSIFGVYEKLKGKSTASTTGDSSVNEGRPSTPATPSAKPKSNPTGAASSGPNPEAEKLKSAGNAAMAQRDYATAIDKYTQAIALSPSNPIYLSNRAAAYSASSKHAEAAADAEIAVASNPMYTKAWSRLGLAKFALGDARGAMEAYQQGIEFEGNGGSEAMKKGFETAKKRVEEMEQDEHELPEEPADDAATAPRGGAGGGMPDLSSLASMLGGGGAGGGGGMPDLGSIMNNPMLAGMARNLMQNPDALSGIMNNPRIQQMMQGMQGGGGGAGGAGGQGGAGGGGMPDLSSLMNDPNIANLAQQFMGGGAGGAGAQGQGNQGRR